MFIIMEIKKKKKMKNSSIIAKQNLKNEHRTNKRATRRKRDIGQDEG